MPFIDISDEVFAVASPRAIADHIKDEGRLRDWFPGVNLAPLEDRGDAGMRWSATGAVNGTAEIWVEPVMDGAVLHTFLRGEVKGSAKPWPLMVKKAAFAIKDALEAGRVVGSARS